MIPINASVASHTILVTVITSLKFTTPNTKATIAPITAVVPICKPFGCQIIKTNVTKNRLIAKIISTLFSLINKSISEINPYINIS